MFNFFVGNVLPYYIPGTFLLEHQFLLFMNLCSWTDAEESTKHLCVSLFLILMHCLTFGEVILTRIYFALPVAFCLIFLFNVITGGQAR